MEVENQISPKKETSNDSLTVEEKSVIDHELAVAAKKLFLVDTQVAYQKIAALGKKTLPYIKDKIPEFRFSQFVYCFAEVKDLNMVLDCLGQSLKNPDGSSASQLIKALQRLIYEIRKENQDDPRLMFAFTKLKEYHHGEIANTSCFSELYSPIALTGTPEAQKYINEAIAKGVSAWSLDKYKTWSEDIKSIDKSKVNIQFSWYLGLGEKSSSPPEIPDPGKSPGGKPEEISKTPIEAKKRKHIFRIAIGNNPPSIKAITEPPGPKETADSGESKTKAVYPEKFVRFFAEMEKLREENPKDEDLVKAMEKKLGIITVLERRLEGALLVDWRLFCTGIVAGYQNPERMFGDKEWAD
jgi:hypothetical protein